MYLTSLRDWHSGWIWPLVSLLVCCGGCGSKSPVTIPKPAASGTTHELAQQNEAASTHVDSAIEAPEMGHGMTSSVRIDEDEQGRQEPREDDETARRFRFVDCAASRGLEFAYRNGEENGQFAVLENLGGGVAWVDVDRNGFPDVVVAGGGSVTQERLVHGNDFGLFLNHEGQFRNAALPSRFRPTERFSHGVCVCDVNNDGFDDLLVTGFEGASLLLNLGDGTFEEVEHKTFNPIPGISTSAASGDFNGDHVPDLYIATYVDWSFDNHPFCPAPSGESRELCSPKDFAGTSDFLFYGQGDGTFLQMNESAGMLPKGKGLGVLTADVDRDGDLDIYVANDTTDNFLYLNDGRGVFKESGLLSGVAIDERALPNGSMGLTACDINDDLAMDLWVSNYERESFALYRNEGNAFFLHASRRYGISALGGQFVGFGTDWEDFDLDGYEEIVVTNGHVLRFPTGAPRRQQPLLLRREGDRFVRQSFPQTSYFAGDYEGRGLAVGDWDRDGRSDVAITHLNEPIALLRNESGVAGRSLRVFLVGTTSTRNAEGAVIELETSRGKQMQVIVGGGSYLSHNERVATFGIAEGDQPLEVKIYWPSGVVQNIAQGLDAPTVLAVEP